MLFRVSSVYCSRNPVRKGDRLVNGLLTQYPILADYNAYEKDCNCFINIANLAELRGLIKRIKNQPWESDGETIALDFSSEPPLLLICD